MSLPFPNAGLPGPDFDFEKQCAEIGLELPESVTVFFRHVLCCEVCRGMVDPSSQKQFIINCLSGDFTFPCPEGGALAIACHDDFHKVMIPFIERVAAAQSAALPLTVPQQVGFECYLCNLAGEPAKHEGFPPGFDFASKLPVCAVHVKEPTSVDSRTSVQIEGRLTCGMCGGHFSQPHYSERALSINGKNWIIDPSPGQWSQGEPFSLCSQCLINALELMATKLRKAVAA